MSPNSDPDIDASLADLDTPGEPAPPWPPADWVMPLRKPLIDAAGSTLTELALREPTDDDHVKIYAHPPETRRRFAVSLIAGVPMATVAQIGVGDVEIAAAYITAFFDLAQAIRPWSPPSSPTSSAGTP